jgi:hypothetical protein
MVQKKMLPRAVLFNCNVYFFQPQESGNYTFYAACTDECEVFLRDGESGGTLQKIISLKKATKYQHWR